MSNSHYIFGRLFANPSFVEGMSRILDIGNTLREYNESETEQGADIDALKNDWRAVGDDLRASILKYEREQRVTR